MFQGSSVRRQFQVSFIKNKIGLNIGYLTKWTSCYKIEALLIFEIQIKSMKITKVANYYYYYE